MRQTFTGPVVGRAATALLAVILVLAPAVATPAAADSVASTISVGNNPYGVAVSPDGTKVYTTDAGNDTVSVISVATNAVVATIPVGANPVDVVFSHDGQKAFVTGFNGNVVSVIDAATDSFVANIPVSSTPYRIAVSADGTKAYVSHFAPGGSVDVIDVATNAVTTTIYAGAWLADVAFAPNGQIAYVAGAGGLIVIDVATDSVAGSIALPDPTGVVFSPDSTVAYLSDPSGPSLLVLDVVSGTVVDSIPVGATPRGVDVTSDGSKVYVANTGANTVTVIDTATATAVETITVGTSPIGVAFTPSGVSAYVTNVDDLTVSRLAVDLLAILVPQTPVPGAFVGSAFSFATATSGGTPGAFFSISVGALPAGLTLNAASGVVSGVPTVTGVFPFTVSATNAAGNASNDYSITVAAALPPMGSSPGPLLGAAALLLLLGSLGLALRRPRRVH